jgi:hypothetical protein
MIYFRILFFLIISLTLSCLQNEDLNYIIKSDSLLTEMDSVFNINNEMDWNSGKVGLSNIELILEKKSHIDRVEFKLFSSPSSSYIVNLLSYNDELNTYESIAIKKIQKNDSLFIYNVDFPLKNVSKLKLELINHESWHSFSDLKIYGK